MQEGSFRCDANISLRPVGQEKLGTRTELKNMNSFKNVQAALEYEVRRQRDVLLDGGNVRQETLQWDPDRKQTSSMRGKEEAHDYRYFPCPDLIPIVIDDEWIEEIRKTLPELPDARKERFVSEYALPEYDAAILTASKDLADFFEEAVEGGAKAKKVSNWLMTEFLRELNGAEITSCKVTSKQLGALLKMVDDGTISGKIAKIVFPEMMESGKDPEVVVKEKNLVQVSDQGELLVMVAEIIAANPEQAADFKGGKTKLMGYFVGQLMQKTKGKANPKVANELFSKELNK
jgi:aspartyl-tRNA(Asn)/glutamyl-tRNA(Gln) amidotransferase subunit B